MSTRALEMFRSLREDLGEAELVLLDQEVRAHVARLAAAAQRRHELIAVDPAGAARGAAAGAVLELAPTLDAEGRASIVGAARYFCSTDDETPDEGSCTGLDDDVAVFNHVVEALERPDLILLDD
ncbi:MAG: hypothetical protein IPG04_09310 [Polyangiaceae bacterium]|nr:hypothetical protein [Polyangiaceae bacterium]